MEAMSRVAVRVRNSVYGTVKVQYIPPLGSCSLLSYVFRIYFLAVKHVFNAVCSTLKFYRSILFITCL